MRSGNPALRDSTFTTVPRERGGAVMTIEGTVYKTAMLLALAVGAAAVVWEPFLAAFQRGAGFGWVMAAAIGGLVLAMVTIFKKTWSPVTAPLYALVEGVVLGGITVAFEFQYPGIALQAVMLTAAILFALLFAYRSGLIKATENFKLGVMAATGGIALVYIASMVLGMFGITIPYLHEGGPIGIGISVFIVIVAALNLVLDFDFIEQGAKAGAPKYMEWYAAFGLLVTLVWLYLEILRLLAKTRR